MKTRLACCIAPGAHDAVQQRQSRPLKHGRTGAQAKQAETPTRKPAPRRRITRDITEATTAIRYKRRGLAIGGIYSLLANPHRQRHADAMMTPLGRASRTQLNTNGAGKTLNDAIKRVHTKNHVLLLKGVP